MEYDLFFWAKTEPDNAEPSSADQNQQSQETRSPEIQWHVMNQLAREPVTKEPESQWAGASKRRNHWAATIRGTDYSSELNFS